MRTILAWCWNDKWAEIFKILIIFLLAMELFPWPDWLIFFAICGTISSLLAGIDATKGRIE